jgi:hypothetical protein
MKKEPVAKRVDDMRKEYDLSKLAGGVRGTFLTIVRIAEIPGIENRAQGSGSGE